MPLSDIVALGPHSVEEIIAEETPYSKGTWFFAKRIGDLELIVLGSVLGAGSPELLRKGFKLIGEPLDDGPWPMTIPTELTDAVLRVNEDQARSAAEEWARTGEFWETPSAANLAEYILGLREFLRSNTGPYVLMLAL